MSTTIKPTHLKLLAGNPGRRPINTEEPIPENALRGTTAPKELGYTGKKMWKICLDNSPKELLKSLDYVELMRYCMAYELYTDACRKIKKEGAVITKVNGDVVESPWVKILNQQSQILNSSANALGFSPASRTRIKIQAEGKKKSKFAVLDGDKK